MEGCGVVVVDVMVGVVAAAVVRSDPPAGGAEDQLDDTALGGGLGCSLKSKHRLL